MRISLGILLVLAICLSYNLCECYKILVVFPMHWISHGILGYACVDILLEAGHEVTYVSWGMPVYLESHQNLTVIDISYPLDTSERYNINRFVNREVKLANVNDVTWVMVTLQSKIIENEKIQKLLNDPNVHFDVAILEWIYGEFIVGLPAVFDCPYIWFSTMEPHPLIFNLLGETANPTYVPLVVFGDIAPLSFMQRFWALTDLVSAYLFKILYVHAEEEKEYQRLVVPLLAKRRSVVPSYDELRYNASLIFGNSHISVGHSIALPEAYKAVGGYHVKKDKHPLPADLKMLMDKSKHGVIYFSMGSGIKTEELPVDVINKIANVFSKLKQTVIWKFKEDIPNRPSNVHTISWSPQQSILAHPNCVLFITHGGQLSSLEAVHFGVPLIGIPVFADQHRNVKTLVRSGMAIEVDLSYNMAEDLKVAIEEILGDSSYAQAARHQSFIYHHRPLSPKAEIIHWVEHVIQTKGAKHLRSISRLVPWYQKYYLDLIFVIFITVMLLIQIVKRSLMRMSTETKRVNLKKTQ